MELLAIFIIIALAMIEYRLRKIQLAVEAANVPTLTEAQIEACAGPRK